jgi:hypothetical protein
VKGYQITYHLPSNFFDCGFFFVWSTFITPAGEVEQGHSITRVLNLDVDTKFSTNIKLYCRPVYCARTKFVQEIDTYLIAH